MFLLEREFAFALATAVFIVGVVATTIGPRIVRYGFVGGDNLLGWVPKDEVKTALGSWKPWGGHRLWTAPEAMPRSYSPDNEPVDVQISGGTVTLTPVALLISTALPASVKTRV